MAKMKKELLVVIFILNFFCSYLIDFKVIVLTYHAALKYILLKGDPKPQLIKWIFLLEEFNLEDMSVV